MVQKQPFANVFQNSCSYKFCNIHRKITVLQSLFDKVVGHQAFIKIRLQHRYFPVNLRNF